MKILCFDIGGTSIKYSLFENGNIGEIFQMPTRVSSEENYILEDVLEKISEYSNIDAIGISTAGVVDNKKGEVVFAGPTIPKYTGTKIRETIENKYKIPTFVENDVNAAAYGEYIKGNYTEDVFCLTVGTGVGGALIINNSIYNGFSNRAGEIGYMIIKENNFQDIASTTFLVNRVSEKLNKKVNGKYVFENAKNGCETCENAINELVDNLSIGIANIIYIFNPKCVIIGGGITAQGKYLEDKIKKQVYSKLISKEFETEIKLATVENAAGLYGIYYITKKGLEK